MVQFTEVKDFEQFTITLRFGAAATAKSSACISVNNGPFGANAGDGLVLRI